MPKKCNHIEECDDCSQAVEKVQVSEPISRIQQILVTLERQQTHLEQAISDRERFKLSAERGMKEFNATVSRLKVGLDQTRIQLETELKKLDPAIPAETVHA